MKFEIDEETGMVYTEFLGNDLQEDNSVTHENLEQILQAVKKTQTKLINKDIQEIQDSKSTNPLIIKDDTKFDYRGTIFTMEKMDQNQKIVDELKELFSVGDTCDWMDIIRKGESSVDFLFRIKKKLGKAQYILNIKDF